MVTLARGAASLAPRARQWLELAPLRVRKAAWMARRPTWRSLLRAGVAPSLEHAAILADRSFETVVDVGANVGQFAVWADVALRPRTIICIEPQSSATRLLTQVAARTRASTQVVRVALGSAERIATLHVTRANDSSSLLPPLAVESRHDLHVVEIEDVHVVTGDAALADFVPLARPVLVKVDVQGSELDALKGLTSTLREADAVLVEVSVTGTYHEQALFPEVVALLTRLGFEPTAASSVPGAGRQLLEQIDLLFERLI